MWLIIIVILAGAADPAGAETLESLVAQYLAAEDALAAGRLLAAIERQAPSVEAIAAALDRQTKNRVYPKAKTGSRHGLPVTVGGETFDYAVSIPTSYDPAKAYPLIICLHGAGFVGETYLERWRPRLGDAYLLACPTLEDAAWWSRLAAMLVLRTIAEMERQYHVDPDRVFLTGMSNGGIGTYRIGMLYADRFAALSPMAGMIPDPLFPLLENLATLPVYMIHGSRDEVIPVELSRKIAARLKALGYPVVYREHDQVHPQAGGHFFPKDELPALVAWLGARRREAYPKKVICVRGIEEPATCYWVRLDEGMTVQPIQNRGQDRGQHPERTVRFMTLTAEVKDRHTILVTTDGVARYTLLLNEGVMDLAAPLTVSTNGVQQFRGIVPKETGALLREARLRPDLRFPAALSFTVPAR